jgi:hypothetical protein
MLTVLVPGGTTFTAGVEANLFSWRTTPISLSLVLESSILVLSATAVARLAPSINQ